MDILAHIIAYLIFAGLILCGLGIVVSIARFFYYRKWKSDRIRVYYDDNDHRKGYYIVNRPRGPYPVGYPKEQIVKNMEEFERLRREQKEKQKNRGAEDVKYTTKTPRPMWLQILLMTPAEYMEYRRRRKEAKRLQG